MAELPVRKVVTHCRQQGRSVQAVGQILLCYYLARLIRGNGIPALKIDAIRLERSVANWGKPDFSHLPVKIRRRGIFYAEIVNRH